ncbi:transcription factor bHLH129-like [Bidens hawaiensis]|uniref:transcription factor bHLH129-like n=1 Tax=Bidens hawaiensis TaxID=980011 RepID=UPI00404A982E
MYPTSDSSSSPQPPRDHHTNNNNGNSHVGGGIGLARYRSAPVAFLNTAVDSVINEEAGGQQQHMVNGTPTTRFFDTSVERPQTTTSFRLNEFATAFHGMKTTNQSPSPLFRHGSSPAGFLNALVSSTPADGRSSRLSSQISFAGTTSYSQIPEETNVFSSSSSHSKRAKNSIDMNGLNIMESEFNFGLSESGLEATTMDLPQDSVPCKIRAKRGCATHPRSIAERERRTRISGKLKKLQDLVPNMDKQTSYSDMLDLAVQHIKGLQTHVQSLKKELQNCSCGCKPT